MARYTLGALVLTLAQKGVVSQTPFAAMPVYNVASASFIGDAVETQMTVDSFDPRPVGLAVAAANVEPPFPSADGSAVFFETVTYSGAFAPTGATWLTGWSYLDCVQGTLAAGTCSTDPNTATGLPFGTSTAGFVAHTGDITSDETWAYDNGNTVHVLTGQTFVKSGATLTIEAGVTVYAYKIAAGFDAAVALPSGVCSATSCTTANSCIYIAAADVCKPFTTVLVVESNAQIERGALGPARPPPSPPTRRRPTSPAPRPPSPTPPLAPSSPMARAATGAVSLFSVKPR